MYMHRYICFNNYCLLMPVFLSVHSSFYIKLTILFTANLNYYYYYYSETVVY